MLSRLAVAAIVLSCWASPASAQPKIDICAVHLDLAPVAPAPSDAKSGAAPADVDFGLYPMSVLGIENTLRRDGAAIDEGSDRSALTTGPLACVVDSIRAWERAYPADPWIAKNLLTLEVVYLRAPGAEARELASHAEAWLEHDYPLSSYLEPARLALGKQQREPIAAARERETPKPPVVERVVEAFVTKPISLVAAAIPPPISLLAALPEIKFLSSPWERFAPLDSDHR